jgi:hypothetical protein
LQEEQTKCDNCGTILFYKCNSCKEEFKIVDKTKKLKICPLCGYFFCPHCSVCSWSCSRYLWESDVLKILAPEITMGKFPETLKKVREIIKYFVKVKTSNERKECIRNVPITYAKMRVKSLLCKVEGFRVKNEKDREGFVSRMNELISKPSGFKTTVSNIREAGSYGQEYRDAFNLLVCMGKLRIKWITKENGEEYSEFERVEDEPCKFLAREDLIINECEKCKRRFAKGIKFCDICIKKKGKEKGQPFKTKERMNNQDTCQMYRGDFK